MKLQTHFKAGGHKMNHNEVIICQPTKGLTVQTNIKAGEQKMNHNEMLSRSKGVKVKTKIRAGGHKLNHNETFTQAEVRATPADTFAVPNLNLNQLRQAIQSEYQVVAENPTHGFHFHTGRPLSQILGYEDHWLEGIPESSIESFAGTGNPFSLGEPQPGERVVDVGCGAGIDSLIASKMVGPEGQVIGVDMTSAMLNKAQQAGDDAGFDRVEFRQGFGEALPVPDGWADVVISNGVLNLFPDKSKALAEMVRVLKPGGRLQIADILVEKPVPHGAKENIDLWTG